MLLICNNHASVVDSGKGSFSGDEPSAVFQNPFEDLGLLRFHIGARRIVLQEMNPPALRIQSLQLQFTDLEFDIWAAEDDTAPVGRPGLPVPFLLGFELPAVVGQIGIDVLGGPSLAPAVNAQLQSLFKLGHIRSGGWCGRCLRWRSWLGLDAFRRLRSSRGG